MLQSYLDCLETIRLIGRLHRRFLDLIKAELDRLGISDINNVQALILSNIGEEQLNIGELTVRGYYLGSNVSYKVKKLVENEYLEQERSSHDKRAMRIRLTQKGHDLCECVNELYERNCTALSKGVLGADDLTEVNESLRTLERVWSDYISYGRF